MQPSSQALAASNPRLKLLRRLVRESKTRRSEGVFVVEGPKLVAEALSSALAVREIYTAVDSDIELRDADGVPSFAVDEGVLSSVLDPVNPQAIAALVERPLGQPQELLAGRPVVVAEELRDPGNLGTIMRSIEASGAGGLIVAGSSVDPFNPKTVRASAGSVLRVPIVVTNDLDEALTVVGSLGRRLVATVCDANAQAYDRCELADTALLVGNEPRGLSAAALTIAEERVTIPVESSVDSLNVAAATAVLCFEAARQRRQHARLQRPSE